MIADIEDCKSPFLEPGTISKFAIRSPQFNKGRHAPVGGAAMTNGWRAVAMQLPTLANEKQARLGLRERMQENVIHHVG